MRTLVVILALGLAAAAFGGTVPFNPFQGLVEVDVEIDGHARGRFGIDTGADFLYIDRAFAKKNQLTLKDGPPQRGVVGIDGYSEAGSIPVRSLDVAGERVYNLNATSIDMNAFISDDRADPPDGLIGYEVLKRFYVTVDYPGRQMTLQQHEPSFVGTDALPGVPFRIAKHLIILDVTFDDSVTVPMALDYCASYTYLSPALAARLGVDPNGGENRTGKISLGGIIESTDVLVGVADMSNLTARLPNVQLEGLIGGTFLFRHKITIDYHRDRIYVHK